ncbi:hypothetical protein J4E83_001175 [Alternaria metachromatica]|uniref:uncharacterized protein n=1 Tax=Alternaria metachromatica TaxID=283354 RepID=UPI0020C3AA3E|nr:uncharacterized protein J4E83_001175 [Alternaria metachromatica]KAI4636221.1 hypothetical protein J4E83_001175 [Alternaria metachromatica]
MSFLNLLALSLTFRIASARVLGTFTGLPYPTLKPPSRREDSSALPTFTLGPEDAYFPSTAAGPEPSGSEVQVYPTGVYDTFPADGITVAFGPEIHEQMKTVRAESCNNKPAEECRDAINGVIQKTGVSTHVKRFIPVAPWVLWLLAGWVLSTIAYEYNQDLGKAIKLPPEDLRQIQSMAGAQEIAIVTAADASAIAATLTIRPPATTTPTSLISIETLTTASDGHEAGDIVYHIPEGTAGRIQDFLGMTGLQETQQICQGQDLKRADTTEECIERILRHAMDLADTGPDNLMALAQANIPIEPAVGQAIGFPIPDISIGESVVIVRLYRQVFTATAPAPQPDLNWDPSVLARSALSLAIAAHAAMLVGQTLLDIFVSKSDIITDLKEEDLTCAKDLICTLDDFVEYPYVYEVPKGYMDAQYAWLEELIKRAEEPVLEAECKSNLQRFDEGTLGPPNPGSSQTFDPRSSFEG